MMRHSDRVRTSRASISPTEPEANADDWRQCTVNVSFDESVGSRVVIATGSAIDGVFDQDRRSRLLDGLEAARRS